MGKNDLHGHPFLHHFHIRMDPIYSLISPETLASEKSSTNPACTQQLLQEDHPAIDE